MHCFTNSVELRSLLKLLLLQTLQKFRVSDDKIRMNVTDCTNFVTDDKADLSKFVSEEVLVLWKVLEHPTSVHP